MENCQDFKEFFDSLNQHEVEYLIVGAYALAHYGCVRNTKDIDVWVGPTKENAPKVVAALNKIGFVSPDLTPDKFDHADAFLRLGRQPVQNDILTKLLGVNWQQAWPKRSAGQYHGVSVWYLHQDEFIQAKKASGRLQDLADVERLLKQRPDSENDSD